MSSVDGSGSAPWSPFPVQDWSNLPDDPLATPVDPTWGPPPDPHRQRWWVPLVVLLGIGALIASAAYAGVALGSRTPSTAALAYLPDDGAAAYEQVRTTREAETSTTMVVTESARLNGATAWQSSDFAFTSQAMADAMDFRDLRVWRTASTPAEGSEPGQTTRIYQVNDAVKLLGESSPAQGYAYNPGLLELPAEVASGQTWHSEGTASPGDLTESVHYRADFRSGGGDRGGCLPVTGEIRYRALTGTATWTVGVERLWCRGRGLVGSSESRGPIRTVTTAADRWSPPAPNTVDPPLQMSDPATWTEHDLTVVTANPHFGDGPMTGAAHGSIAPVRTASGLVIRPMHTPADLVATRSRNATEMVTVWRAHPGGSIVSLARFGDVVVVTTSQRTVTAYTDRGVRLWQRRLDEIGPTSAVRLGPDRIVLADLSGRVTALSLAGGQPLWTAQVGSDVSLAPVAGSGLVVVMDRSGTTTALSATDGTQRWTAELLGKAGSVTGDQVLVVQDQVVHARDAATGQTRWLRPFLGTLSGVLSIGETTLVASQTTTVALDGAGVIRHRLGAALALTTAGDQAIGWGTDQAELVTADGRVDHRWPIPASTVVSQNRLAVATPDGPILFNADWTAKAWTR